MAYSPRSREQLLGTSHDLIRSLRHAERSIAYAIGSDNAPSYKGAAAKRRISHMRRRSSSSVRRLSRLDESDKGQNAAAEHDIASHKMQNLARDLLDADTNDLYQLLRTVPQPEKPPRLKAQRRRSRAPALDTTATTESGGSSAAVHSKAARCHQQEQVDSGEEAHGEPGEHEERSAAVILASDREMRRSRATRKRAQTQAKGNMRKMVHGSNNNGTHLVEKETSPARRWSDGGKEVEEQVTWAHEKQRDTEVRLQMETLSLERARASVERQYRALEGEVVQKLKAEAEARARAAEEAAARQRASLQRRVELMKTVARVLSETNQRFMQDAWSLWLEWLELDNGRRQARAELVLRRGVHRWLPQYTLRRMREEQQREAAEKEWRTEVLCFTRKICARKIVRAWHAACEAGRVGVRKEEDYAWSIIQRTVFRFRARTCLMTEVSRRRRAAIKIQVLLRGWLVRKRLGFVRSQALHVKRWAKYAALATVIKTSFELDGAAETLQVWWRRKHLRMRFVEVALLALATHLQRVRLAQAAARGFVCRRRVCCRRLERSTRAVLISYVRIALWCASNKRYSRLYEKRTRDDEKRQAEEERKKRKLLRLAEIEARRREVGIGMDALLRLTSTIRSFGVRTTNASVDLKTPESALVIQSWWRVRMARKKLRALRAEAFVHKVGSVVRLQRWYRRMRWHAAARKRWGAVHTVQVWSKKARGQKHMRLKAAITVQRVIRGFLCRRALRAHRSATRFLAVRLQALWRGVMARQRYDTLRNEAVRRRETANAGRLLHHATFRLHVQRQLLAVARQDDGGGKGELQQLFLRYRTDLASAKTTGRLATTITPSLDVEQFVRLCRECDLLQRFDGVDEQAAEALFNQHQRGRSLTYSRFIRALRALAMQILVHVHGRWGLSDEDARFVQLMMDVVLSSAVGVEVVSHIKARDRCDHGVKHLFERSARVIQSAYRHHRTRYLLLAARVCRQRNEERRKTMNAVILIQKHYRRYRARLIVCRLASSIYEKVIHSNTRQTYYFNPRTGRASHTPALLHGQAVGTCSPIFVAEPDRAFELRCDVCETRVARTHCLECNKYFCARHFSSTHQHHPLAAHTRFVPVDLCVQCSRQVATRACLKCNDDYCDTCFEDLHRGGQLHRHPWRPLAPMCDSCKRYVALCQCLTCSVKVCRRCARQQHPVSTTQPGRAFQTVHVVTDLTYQSQKLAQYQGVLDAEQAQLAAAEATRMEQLAREEALRQRAATTIQAAWRGYSVRVPYRKLNGDPRLRQMRQAADDLIRASVVYKVKELMGVAPILFTDPVPVRVLKRFPWWLHKVVTEAVDNQWIDALHEAEEQEAFERTQTFAEKHAWHVKEKVALTKLRVEHTLRGLVLRLLSTDIAAAKDRAQKTVDKKAKDKLWRQVKLMKEKREELDKRLKAIQVARATILRDLDIRGGPNRLRKRLWNLRRHGHKLAFKVQVSQGSSQCTASVRQATLLKPGQRLRLSKSSFKKGSSYRVIRTTRQQDAETKAVYYTVELDRDWMRDDGDVSVFKAPSPSSLVLPLDRLAYALKRNPATQTLVWTAGFYIYSCKAFCLKKAADAEEAQKGAVSTEDALAAAAAAIKAKKWKRQAAKFDRLVAHVMEHRVRFTNYHRAKGVLGNLRWLFKAVMLPIYRKMVDRVEATREYNERMKDPWFRWEQSRTKSCVVISWQGQDQAEVVVLGEVMIDVDAPLSALRGAIRRRLREQLNARCGEAFGFLHKGDTILIRAYEDTRRVCEQAHVEKKEKKKATYMVVIAPEPGEERVEVPVFTDEPPPPPPQEEDDSSA